MFWEVVENEILIHRKENRLEMDYREGWGVSPRMLVVCLQDMMVLCR